ncbi:hypothetical protein [Desulforamulus ruminis]|uniref:Uncharacterized protein n=1 Tax=Desulforamulus ruminis (strain ATCC 23193 / DSM 2154 / NCIMB 8452 / DL) TaxID=696281 RepID=F6DKZ0_DESRL|nr:hypothetical protein [Desulforamulus ruminis]AEG61622.1 hypothetical protein Desru_3419 [Desulforamulus ruminis DSM 2154]
MRNWIIFIFKPRQLVKLLVALVCLMILTNIVWQRLKPTEPPPSRSWPGSEVPEIQRGEFLSWDEVDKIFKRYTNATVVDVDTGLSFRVQRRGGTYHADVQPLTAGDTAIMKAIYNGEWSWRRKAVVVEVGGRKLAASMNGMPHGDGAIRGNNFKGHFCIHFRDSKVHQSGEENLAHQMMVWKSAGRFKQMISAMAPEEVIEVFITAIDLQDADSALKTMYKPSEEVRDTVKGMVSDISRIKVQRVRPESGSHEHYWVYLNMIYRGEKKEVEKKIRLRMIDQGESGWKLTGEGLDDFLDRKAVIEVFNTQTFDEEDFCD